MIPSAVSPQPFATFHLDAAAFDAAVFALRERVTRGRKLSAEAESAARAVLVERQRQADVAKRLGVQRQQINAWVRQIALMHKELNPDET